MYNLKSDQAPISEMKVVAYYIISLFQFWQKTGEIKRMLDCLKYTNYHNFSKCKVPLIWYREIRDKLYLDSNDLLVEIAAVKDNHMHELHYHKLSHALCIILGQQEGFNTCSFGEVIKDKEVIRSFDGLEVYFPSYCEHTFNASYSNQTGPLYFLSIQSPPLLTKERDDFYLVNSK